ncbi:E3 ubiquitin-protein ligase BRE1A-like [Corticium candelabrum]|uniref:E3 ubiquitin-protein ligase BRE1A-like n=1 Tax=Corticium candelabrum TaxID=121492 RepID=UPI002E2580AE|nr:E3 ubiquitin-protein ligase BRE1A-like [Corticium candelabrum]
MSKRSVQEGMSGQPPTKVSRTLLTPRFGPVSSQEELDVRTLQLQNKMLAAKIKERIFREEELHKQIAESNSSRSRLESTLSLVNRHWDQLDGDVRFMLQRMEGDAEGAQPVEDTAAHVSMFLQKLLKSHYQEDIEAATAKRYQVSKTVVAELVQAIEAIRREREQLVERMKSDDFDANEELVKRIEELVNENGRLSEQVSRSHAEQHEHQKEFELLRDKFTIAEERVEKLTTSLDDNQFDLQKASQRIEKLEMQLSEALQAAQAQGTDSKESEGQALMAVAVAANVENVKEEVSVELAEMQEIVATREKELTEQQQKYEKVCQEVERLKLEVNQVSDTAVLASVPYKILQTQFSVLYSDYMQLRVQLEETRRLLTTNKGQYMQQLDEIEAEEQKFHHKTKEEVSKLNNTLSKLKRDYHTVRMEYEQHVAATEQAGPINKEMRHLIGSLQNSNQQLKNELARYKRKFNDAHHQLAQYRLEGKAISEPCEHEDSSLLAVEEKEGQETGQGGSEEEKAESELVRELKASLKKAQESQKEMKLLLDVYKGLAKEQREKVELLSAEKQIKGELEEAKAKLVEMEEQLKRLQSMANYEAVQRLRAAEETIKQMQKDLTHAKHDEDAMLSEMEVTAQAFEDMQEQNARLLQQLHEKEDANLKLMSERIKLTHLQQLLTEQQEGQVKHIAMLESQQQAQNEVCQRVEEREKSLQASMTAMEKEVTLRQQAMDSHRKRAIEAGQAVQEAKFQLEKQIEHIQQLQAALDSKTSAMEQESFRSRRAEEENTRLNRKLERQKKFGIATTADEILKEELRTYKSKLVCPCCNTNKKDCVLTKCFHVFCTDCIKTRYETRQRKCPKCAAAFGANDFHKIYLS